MLIDGKSVVAGSVLRTDICIVGTGMGALSAAVRLVAAGHKVLFVEAGPRFRSARNQMAIKAEFVGRPFGISTSRGIEIGGGTEFWHGVCARLDPEDFSERHWIPHSGWPIKYTDLTPWYIVAEEFLCSIRNLDQQKNVFMSSGLLSTKAYCYRSPPFRGRELLEKWSSEGRITCVYNSAALHLRYSRGKAQSLDVGSGDHRFSVKANDFVIAAGALETPRLLLNSTTKETETQPPRSWWLGRNLIDHPVGYLSQVRFHEPLSSQTVKSNGPYPSLSIMSGLVLSSDVQRQYQVPNNTVFIREGFSKRPVPNKAVMSFLGVRNLRDLKLSHASLLLRHPYIIRRIVQQKLGLRRRSQYGDLFFMTEQLPNPDSRISLSEKMCDRFGYPVARVEWRLGKGDIATFAAYHEIVLINLAANENVFELRVDSIAHWEESVASGAHHLGTARMAATIKDGVVDENLKVFGIDNVWISDGSVFPTAGSVNPSLTICALGHRLGAHLCELRGNAYTWSASEKSA